MLFGLASNVTTVLEKGFVTCKLVESAVKYADYLQEKLACGTSYQSREDNM